MNKVHLFAPLVKIDEARREAWGTLAEEKADKVGEIFDYEGSKPYFQKWSENFSKVTNGKSLGNVREMHGKTAAGKLISMTFNDAEKTIDVGAWVGDDSTWKKCETGILTGFSIGANVVTREKQGDFVKYVGDPIEVSLVDNPCMYGTHFTAVKAEGLEEERLFIGAPVQIWTCEKTADHLHEGKSDAIACRAGAVKELSIVTDEPASSPESNTEQENEMNEAEIQKMVTEAVESHMKAVAEKAVAGTTEKIEEPVSRADFEKLEKAFTESETARGELVKQNEDLTGAFKALTDTVCALEARTPKLSDPAPAKGFLRAVSKAEDGGAAPEKEAPKPGSTEDVTNKIMEAFKRPVAVSA